MQRELALTWTEYAISAMCVFSFNMHAFQPACIFSFLSCFLERLPYHLDSYHCRK